MGGVGPGSSPSSSLSPSPSAASASATREGLAPSIIVRRVGGSSGCSLSIAEINESSARRTRAWMSACIFFESRPVRHMSARVSSAGEAMLHMSHSSSPRRRSKLTSLLRRILLGDARVEPRASLLIALLPVLARALVIAVPASRPRSVLLRCILAAPGAEVLKTRVAPARKRVEGMSDGSRTAVSLCRGEVTAFWAYHAAEREETGAR